MQWAVCLQLLVRCCADGVWGRRATASRRELPSNLELQQDPLQDVLDIQAMAHYTTKCKTSCRTVLI